MDHCRSGSYRSKWRPWKTATVLHTARAKQAWNDGRSWTARLQPSSVSCSLLCASLRMNCSKLSRTEQIYMPRMQLSQASSTKQGTSRSSSTKRFAPSIVACCCQLPGYRSPLLSPIQCNVANLVHRTELIVAILWGQACKCRSCMQACKHYTFIAS